MRKPLMIGALSLVLLASKASAAGTTTLSDAVAAVLQADGHRAVMLFDRVKDSEASARDRRIARCASARLGGTASMPPPPVSGDVLADAVLEAYRTYWKRAMDPTRRVEAERDLFASLRAAVGRADLGDRDKVLEEVSVQLNARGISTSQGMTGPLYELLLYLDEEEKAYVVDLPDGTKHDVKVFFMREMVSYGWARHLTCGRTGTGGFATDAGLYVVADKYDLESESFLVSFLAHETRHFADYERYPGMEGPELEYRAKLTELALANKTLSDLLDYMRSDQNDDRSTPHSYANKRVLAAIAGHLRLPAGTDIGSADPGRIRQAARQLIFEDNRTRDQEKEKAKVKP